MTMQSAWGTALGDPLGNKSWAEDAMDEEAEHGQIAAPEARVARPPDEHEFPSLGLGGQSAASKGGGGKKGKRVKGRKMALDEFNSVGGGHHDERSKIMNALPKHATGEDVPDRFSRGGGGMGHRPRMDDEPSKADGSDNWGSDRIRQPPKPGGFGGGGGAGGFGGGGGGFSRADDDAAWSRGGGGGMGPPAPRRNGFGGGPPRGDDDGGAWARGTARPQMPDRPDRGGFGASRANEEGAWSRGTRAPEARGDGGGGRFNDRRADEEEVWSRGAVQQPPAPGGDGQFRGAQSQADDASTWARKEPRERPAPVQREVPASDAVDNWTRGKPGPMAARRPGKTTDSPRNSPRGSVAGSEKSGFASPRESRDGHKSAADEVKTWGHNPQAVKKAQPHPREGRWGKQEAPINKDPPKKREERFSKPEQPSPKVEVEEPREEEQQLQVKLAELQLRQEAGEGDADSLDVGEDGGLISIDQAYEACKVQVEELAAARHAKAQEGTADAAKWAKAPKQDATMSESATETVEKVEAGDDGEAEEEGDDGFSEVVSKAAAKREKAAAKAAQPASGRGSSGGGKSPATSTPPKKSGSKW